MNVSVSIPVEIGGYTGQRDAWESHQEDWEVKIEDDGRVLLQSHGYTKRKIWFDLEDLQRAVEFIHDREGD
jgi:hypothetical protein